VTLLAGSAFVSGGGSGIGRAIAQALAAQGAAVAVMDLLPEGGKETVASIAAKGGRATFVPGDVARWDDLDRAVAAGVRELGPLGIMVNAAGVLDGYA
jgi:NAD(P)-dependent dehydrogenase (short-subunit alcohol dehydrogenase family)